MSEHTVCTELRENREEGRDAGLLESHSSLSLLAACLSLTFKIFTNPERIYAEW